MNDINKLINEFDMISRWPKRPLDKEDVINWLSEKFEFDKIYSEKEVNAIIKQFHSFDDIALLRRELVSRKYFHRENDGSKYWKTKK